MLTQQLDILEVLKVLKLALFYTVAATSTKFKMNNSFLIVYVFVNYGPRNFCPRFGFKSRYVSSIGNQVFARAITLKTMEL